jgi:hypothetical protein
MNKFMETGKFEFESAKQYVHSSKVYFKINGENKMRWLHLFIEKKNDGWSGSIIIKDFSVTANGSWGEPEASVEWLGKDEPMKAQECMARYLSQRGEIDLNMI